GEVVLGDVIVGINGHKVANFDDLYNTLDRYRVGQKVTVKLERGQKRQAVAVELLLMDIR
ncbi:MAG: PDZ domain-containing protein, partial [Nannocystaceae bacterium]